MILCNCDVADALLLRARMCVCVMLGSPGRFMRALNAKRKQEFLCVDGCNRSTEKPQPEMETDSGNVDQGSEDGSRSSLRCLTAHVQL